MSGCRSKPRPRPARPPRLHAPAARPSLFLTSYEPLVLSPHGRRACEEHGLPPFIDGSIRREPDLEHRFPSISCLCRADKFAPRLQVGDVVIYQTKKGRFGGIAGHRRMTAVLLVTRIFDDHAGAAAWYETQGLPPPRNCMAPGNPPLPVSQTHRGTRHRHLNDATCLRRWEEEYRERAMAFPLFVATEALWKNLDWTAPEVHDADLEAVFGAVPGTQNPGARHISYLTKLARHLRIDVPPYVG
jgi:hypothetical protein